MGSRWYYIINHRLFDWSALAFPVGLLILCIALPLAVFSFGFAFGAFKTRVDDEGIFQRNFFFLTKTFKWNEIESGGIHSVAYNRTDSSGWTTRGTRTYILFTSNEKNLHINSGNTGPENWWADLKKLAKDKLGEKFEE